MTLGYYLFPIGVALATGCAYVWISVEEARRNPMRQRLAALTSAADEAAEEQPISLRRTAAGGAHGARRLLPRQLLAQLQAELAAAGHRIGMLHLIVAFAVGAAVAAGLTAGIMQLTPLIVVPVTAAIGAGACVLLLREAQNRYRRQFLEVFPDALDLLVRSVKAGLPVVDAIELAAREVQPPVSAELRSTLDEMHIGADLQEAFQRTADRLRIADFEFFVVSLGLQRRTGGALAEMLTNLATLIRRRREVVVKSRALTAEARTSAAILALLPVIVVGGLFYINHDLMRLLLFDPRGRFMFGFAIIALTAGIALMFAMVRRAMR